MMDLARGKASVIAATLTSAALAAVALIQPGVPRADVDLNDGGVWVTNAKLRLVAHLNYPSRTLDGGLRAPSESFDLSQSGPHVLVHDLGGSSVLPIDVALVQATTPFSTSGLQVHQGGDRVVVVDPARGAIWGLPVTGLSGFSAEAPPLLQGLTDPRAVVGVDGSIHALSSVGTVTTLAPAGVGWAAPVVRQVDGLPTGGSAMLTAVGPDPVIAHRASGWVWTPWSAQTLPAAADAIVQQPGPAGDSVVFAGPTELITLPLGGGTPTRIPSGGAKPGIPVAPVVVDGCAYAAWAKSARYVRDCPAEADDVAMSIESLGSGTELTFRTNRDVVVLNNTANGDVFVMSDEVVTVNNWPDILAQVENQESQEGESAENSAERAVPNRSADNHKPQAVKDSYGVRPGRTTVLPVLNNDSDLDGDILTAEPKTPPSIGTLARARAGGALQLSVPEGATGSTSFTYTADDGRGGTAEAAVTVSIVSGTNSGPKQVNVTSILKVEQGGEVSYNVRPDWLDPEGDPVFLKSAAAPTGMSVKTREDGLITVRDLGTNQPGRQEVRVTMTDGSADTDGVLKVDVSARGAVPPVANSDHVRVIKGHQVQVSPLANDTDANGDALRLAKVGDAPAGAAITPDYQAGTFRFASDVAGTVYVSYVVTDGPTSADGVIRIDVVDVSNDPPGAEDDVALLPSGGHVLADVLENDFDPAGGVLVVRDVAVAHDSPLSVQVIDRAMLRISAPTGLPADTSFTYTVSNGTAQATATVVVVPLAPVDTNVPPVAADDHVDVRVGDIVTVHVLDNDRSPSGLPITVDPQLQTSATSAQGEAFVSEDTVRFKAGTEPGTVRFVYTIRDSRDNYDSGEVVIAIHAVEDNNSPPRPIALTGRVLAGSTVKIPVPLDGIDPDGDRVTLLGLEQPPAKGTVTARPAWLEYAAPADAAGTDEFSYTVIDRFGARASASVRVGIAAPAPVNQAPLAVADAIVARPDRLLSIPVLLNDIDPDGDRLSLVEGAVVGVGNAAGVRAATTGSRIELTTPNAPGVYVFAYDVTDGRGGTAKGQLTVDVRQDTPLLPPIARDDVVADQDVAGKQEVTVDILANDEDPDGASEALKVDVPVTGATVRGGSVTLPLTQSRQVIRYTITDVDGLTGKAFILLPGLADRLPTLRPARIPATIVAGQTLTVPLADYVSVRDGHTARLTFEDRVKPGLGGNGAPVVKDATTLVFTPHVEYAGPSSLTFEVTDGADVDDPQGFKAVLTLPIEVISSGKHIPVFTPARVTVAAGEDPARVDLTSMVKDADPGDLGTLQFTIGSAPSPYTARLSGHVLEVSTPADTRPGTGAVLDVTVTDGSTPAVSGQIPITSVSSTRPKMAVTEAVVADANAGQPVVVDLNRYVTNPFAAEGKPIVLVGQPKLVSGQAQVSASGTNVTITPAIGFHGQATVTYTVDDATADPTRRASGRISLTVRDVPDAPTAVVAETHASRTATVSWTAGANNGAEISRFTVSWAGGSKDCGRVTTCEITTLTNNVHCTFTVVATNVVGDSAPSAGSNDVRPDARPNQPAAPTTVFGDKQIKVTWAKPTTEGSPVTGYTLEISPGTGGATQVPITGGDTTTHTWSGLTNGTAYTFKVQAHSSAEQPSDFSGYSAPQIPAGVPQALAAPTMTKNPVSALPPSGTLTWPAPQGNGDANMTYQVRRVGTTAIIYTGTARTTGVTMSVDSNDQTFEFQARNKAGWSDWSTASNAVRAFQIPGAVTGLTATATGGDNQIRVTFNPAPGNGALPSEVFYTWSAGGASGSIPSGGGTITSGSLANGQSYAVTITARSTVHGETSPPGPAVTSGAVVPYGPPRVPQVSATGGVNTVTLSWNGNGTANGRAITAMQIETTDGGVQGVGISGSTTQGNGRNQTKSIRAQVQDETGVWSGWSGWASASTWGSPSFSWSAGVWVTQDSPSFCSNGCYVVDLTLRQYDPGSRVRCEVRGQSAASWWGEFTVDGNGNWGTAEANGGMGRQYADPGYVDGGSCWQKP